jgi:hypothetical protein
MEMVPTLKNDVKRIELQVDTNEVSWIVLMLKTVELAHCDAPLRLRRRQWFGQGDGDEEI